MDRSKGVVLIDPEQYFRTVVRDAFAERKITTFALAETYMVNLLEQFISTSHLFFEDQESGERKNQTLAEMYFEAQQAPALVQYERYKRLGDISLYVSGFFGDSLQRKIVDIDYYAEMGGLAYSVLAQSTSEDLKRKIFEEYSTRFLQFAEVLGHISQKSLIQSDENLLRLYDRYIRTGDRLARDLLVEHGIVPDQNKKALKQ